MQPRIWTPDNVTNTSKPALAIRCYWEHQGVRRALEQINLKSFNKGAADVGCGYGRLTPVLCEFAFRVVGYDQSAELLEMARPLVPEVTFTQAWIDDIPAIDKSFDVAMAFTVIQHLDDDTAERVLAEMKRIAGYVLLVEGTHVEVGSVEAEGPHTIYRRPCVYEQMMLPFRLIWTAPRVVEPTRKQRGGTYMLFEGA